MGFRILDTVRKHPLTVRHVGRQLFWTVPAAYGYYTLYTQARASYHDGFIAIARQIATDGREHYREYRAEQQQQKKKKSDGSCCKSNEEVKPM
ncbi:hypothetical protein PG993_012487 [Apiospora rasikravindrae]|uniref:Uncharacterized protein n=1 Tax=Apiospora rasikravindrae TaxID=990691 RepID=A0ABR1S2N7_9PEZI